MHLNWFYWWNTHGLLHFTMILHCYAWALNQWLYIEFIKRKDTFKAASCSSSCFLVNILRPRTFFFLIFVQDLNKDNYQIKLIKILLMATETTICSYNQLGALCQSEIFRQFFVKWLIKQMNQHTTYQKFLQLVNPQYYSKRHCSFNAYSH